MLFNYKALDNTGTERQGSIEAVNIDIAINSLQRRGLVISSIKPQTESGGGILKANISFLSRVSNKDIVILSKQLAILFEAQVSALRIFRLIGSEVENASL